MDKIGYYIRQLRNEKGLTQEQLGALVGVQKAAVQKWENGSVQNLKRATIKKLAEIFNVSPASFVKCENETDTKIPTDSDRLQNPNEKRIFDNILQLNDDGIEALADYSDFLVDQDKFKKAVDIPREA